MITFPNCKINLGLWVTQRRKDGYHNIQTVMYPVPWCDILEIVPAVNAQTILTITGTQIEDNAESNLCFRAWQLMADAYKIPSVRMHLHKVIPAGAGLGGGSSDASFTLKMLNELFDLDLSNEMLRSLAVQLGMDCSFFIENRPSVSKGRGEFLKPLKLTLDGYNLVIVKPPMHVSTAAAFAGISPLHREVSIEELISFPVQDWKNVLYNDFETIVFELYPDIREIKNSLYRQGAVYAALSGSGSAVYGLFSGNQFQVGFPGCTVFQTLLGSQS
ncbi:MAG: 4-(cytidine 5'-diphospho)-2-C-methyl-D-erythritol kinase [Bacteroidota bacterium]